MVAADTSRLYGGIAIGIARESEFRASLEAIV
jgi:hypothetical protein